jgi:hypothetical protein
MVSSNGMKILVWKVRRFLPIVFFVFCGASSSALAACHAITPGGAGLKNGSNWSNAFAGIPGNLVRGDVYYFSDGNYGAYTFSQADSGTTVITFKKAQSYDFGRSSDGCSNDISLGWNTSTMGASQAVFATSGTALNMTADYFTMNGNGTSSGIGCGGAPGSTVAAAPPNPADCGFKLQGTGGATTEIWMGFASSHQTFNYVEIVGSGTNNSSNFEIFASNGFFTLTHSYLHNSGTVFMQDLGNNSSVDHTYLWGTEVNGATAGAHGQAEYEIPGTSNGVRSNNIYRDIQGTAVWTFGQGPGSANDNWKFYNNIVMYSSPQASWKPSTSDGALACINSNTCTNFTFVQNTVINCPSPSSTSLGVSQCGIAWGDSSPGGSVTVQNNLYYSNSSSSNIGLTTNGTKVVEDHNSFLNSPSFGSGAGDVNVSSGAPNPFVNWPAGNFNLASDNAYWRDRLALSLPYTTDAAGNAFTTNRGPYQYNSAQGVNPPSSLTAVVR